MAREKAVKLEEETKRSWWGESYTSLILGMIVVGVIGFIIFSLINRQSQDTSSVTDQTSDEAADGTEAGQKTYTVVAGDDLWTISEKMYKSGYNWVDIASANKLENPNILEVGAKLTIPDVEPKIVTVVQPTTTPTPASAPVANEIKGNEYNVVSGDNLWDISVRAYSDGFKWVEIAKANNLANPDLIFSGNKLTIPR